jgi:hypothetical protein
VVLPDQAHRPAPTRAICWAWVMPASTVESSEGALPNSVTNAAECMAWASDKTVAYPKS